MRVAVVGAGPSGLVTLKYLLTAHEFLGVEAIEARVFEIEPDIGGTFLARTWEDAEMVSSKQLTAFSDFRPRDMDPDFLSTKRYLEYLNDYCTHFQLWPHIHLQTSVQSISRHKGGGHLVEYQDQRTMKQCRWSCDAVAICSGLHVTPTVPPIPGLEKVPTVIHSSQFKERAQFGSNRTILILGAGETATDIAHLAVTSPTKRVVMSHRKGFHLAPKRNLDPVILPILGRRTCDRLTVPIDTSRPSLFDTAYVHPLLRNHTFLWRMYQVYIQSMLWTTTGTTAGFDQWVGGFRPDQNDPSKIFLNKASQVAPYISAPYRHLDDSLTQRIRSSLIQIPIPDTRGRQVDVAPWPEEIDEEGVVHFVNNERPEYYKMKNQIVRPDIVIYCTGYQPEFPFLTNHDNGRPYSSAGDADVRNTWARDDPTVGFIGFLRPSLGAIPPLAEMQAQLWVLRIAAPHRIPRVLVLSDQSHYQIEPPPGSRPCCYYGVDHESYVYQLALDMDSALGFTEVLRLGHRNWRIPLVWALSSNINTKFRLRGPWRWKGAEKVMVGEMWDTICRRRLFFGMSGPEPVRRSLLDRPEWMC
ncbi:FAD/NAD(P)-binding domain-containing protein [Aspergillus alliaceus]|uniref:FAD/NAD(P)-binding domain-containing protein n=1 Tax=Petromyces alliaceus TaxID=209559 RepID=A0A5N7CQA9_PETAA|nr:FAD/NAD(P)-binding domain-containing protein [Aspergillus alliaceus]